jgi:autotransporter-associated beta strand protein
MFMFQEAAAASAEVAKNTNALLGAGIVTFNIGSGRNLTIPSSITNNGGGTGNLTKTGAGTLTLSGSSNYTGNTTVDQGRCT